MLLVLHIVCSITGGPAVAVVPPLHLASDTDYFRHRIAALGALRIESFTAFTTPVWAWRRMIRDPRINKTYSTFSVDTSESALFRPYKYVST